MTEGIAGALGGAVMPADEQVQNDNNKRVNLEGFPTNNMAAIPAWGLGNALGDILTTGFLKDSGFKAALEAAGMTEDDLKSTMGAIMREMTKSLSKATDYLKDDDEEKCAATSMYNS